MFQILNTKYLIRNTKNMTTAYCVKCKEKNAEMEDAKEVDFKRKGGNIGKAMTGIHKKCGTKMFRIMGAAKQ